MSSPRTVIVGSAVPLLLLAGFVCVPVARHLLAPAGAGQSSAVVNASFGSSSPARGSTTTGTATAVVRAGREQLAAVRRLRRSVAASKATAFAGTEVVTIADSRTPLRHRFHLIQRSGGERTITMSSTGSGATRPVTEPVADDGLAGLSDRALGALSAAYELRVSGVATIAGRSATVVTATRGGRTAAQLWLDDKSGLLLREDVRDADGRVLRTAAFEQLQMLGPTPSAGSSLAPAATLLAVGSADAGTAAASTARSATPSWGNDLSAAQLQSWRSKGWPAPARVGAGFVLLDAQGGSSAAGTPMLHLIYGDGLSSVSLFLQRGQLDSTQLGGLVKNTWGDGAVYERSGWPEVMVWQSGGTVITSVGDVESADLREVLNVLAPKSGGGPLESLNHVMRSALAWLPT